MKPPQESPIATLCILACLVWSCAGGPPGLATTEPTRGEGSPPAEWRVCSDSSECVLVVDGVSRCCGTDFVAVNRRYEVQAREAYTDAETPPERACVDSCRAPVASCRGGLCTYE